MNLLPISIAFLAGGILGLLYFGGLWWTVDHLPKAHHPMAFYLVSFGARLAIVAACVVLILQVGTSYLVIATLGFFVTRVYLLARSAHTVSKSKQNSGAI